MRESFLKKMTIVLLNCETIELEPKDVGYVLLKDVSKTVARIACNCVATMETADTFLVEIFPSGNERREDYPEDHPCGTAFGRLTSVADGTQVHLLYEGAEEEDEYYVDYEPYDADAEFYQNRLQTTYLSKTGHLFLLVSKKKALFDLIPKEAADDEKAARASEEMYADD